VTDRSQTPSPAGTELGDPRSLDQLNAEQRARAAFFDGAADFAEVLGIETRDGFFFCRSTDLGVGRKLFIQEGRPEMRLLVRAMAVLKTLGLSEQALAGTFIDVGANIGTSTITAVRRCGFPNAVACEPEPYNCWLLRLNVLANRAEDCVRILPAAVSDARGEIDLLVHPVKSGGHEVYSRAKAKRMTKKAEARRGSRPKTTPVETVTIDWMIEQSLVPDAPAGLLWMDAQGHEGHVLAGAQKLTGHGVPIILEVAPTFLERQGGLGMLVDAATHSYTHLVHIRPSHQARTSEELLEPITTIEEVIEGLAATRKITDLMLLRLAP